MTYTKKQLLQDVEFLAKRQNKAGSFSFNDDGRDTGVSSNSIVSIAYGLLELSKQYFPGDHSDLQACERMWSKLPEHRKQGDALKAMEAARNCNYHGKAKTA